MTKLICSSCNSALVPEKNRGTYLCEYCGSRYILDDDSDEILDINEIIKNGYDCLKNGDFFGARDYFSMYEEECGIPNYDASLGLILSLAERRNIGDLDKVSSAEIFEMDEWKKLIDIAENKDELLEKKAKSCTNFKTTMKTMSERNDSEVLLADELYLMYIAEYREIVKGSDIRKISGHDEFFDNLNSYNMIACTAKNKPAEFYLPAIKDSCRLGFTYTFVIIPTPSESEKDKMIEDMYNYHMDNEVSIILAFVNDIEKIEEIHRYCKIISIYNEYETPSAYFCLKNAYLQGNKLVLIDGNVKDAQNRKNSGIGTGSNSKKWEVSPEEQESVDQKAAWIRNKKCRFCGGDFVGGIFSKTCTKCGRKKDY